MKLLSYNRTARYLGPARFEPFLAKYGQRDHYRTSLILAFAGVLVRPQGSDQITILLPWQTAKQWAMDTGYDVTMRESSGGGHKPIPVTAHQNHVEALADLFYFTPGSAEPSRPHTTEEYLKADEQRREGSLRAEAVRTKRRADEKACKAIRLDREARGVTL